MKHPPQPHPQSVLRVDVAQRGQLLAALRGLAGATLQKIYLLSPRAAALQLRVPGRTLLATLDAVEAVCAISSDKQAAAEREAAPRAQATLRAALAGASLQGARLEREAAAPETSQRAPALRLSFATPRGPRALVAEPRAGVLALLAPAGQAAGGDGDRERIIWTGGPAGDLRAGALWPAVREVAPPPPPAPGGRDPAEKDEDLSARARAQSEQSSLEARRRALIKRFRAQAGKVERTLRAVEADLARAREAQALRLSAQLLLPEQGRIPRGARSAQVPDWSRPDERGRPALVTLSLDPALSAAENAARWLKRAQRYGAAAARIEARLAEISAALADARARLVRSEEATSAAALRELELLEPARAATRGGSRPQAAPRLPFRLFRGSAGGRILVGRSARDNDALTFKAARGNDLWLHARGVQGSHVIVPDPGPQPDPELLREAALLAGHFSSARGGEAVEVAWTRRKHVRKPKGAPAGAVLYTQEKTVRVRASEEALAELLGREER